MNRIIRGRQGSDLEDSTYPPTDTGASAGSNGEAAGKVLCTSAVLLLSVCVSVDVDSPSRTKFPFPSAGQPNGHTSIFTHTSPPRSTPIITNTPGTNMVKRTFHTSTSAPSLTKLEKQSAQRSGLSSDTKDVAPTLASPIHPSQCSQCGIPRSNSSSGRHALIYICTFIHTHDLNMLHK